MRALDRGDPATIGRYRLLARLGTGGMAVVYFARSPGRRAAAVKVMHTDLAADPAYRERFRHEVDATAAVAGRYCPAVLDAGPDAAVPWLATEFLPSVSLRDAVRDHGPFPVEAVWPLAAGLAEALGSVHRAGIVHLDVKPSNVLLTLDGPRLIDFGIAAAVGSAGTTAGTWGFMSPEQASSGPVGAASDVYSLGATLAFACTGAQPGARHGAVGPEQIADARLRDLVARCMGSDARGRPSVDELVNQVGAAAGAAWLPAAVRADIDRGAGEARNPPVAPVSGPPPGFSRRRALLLAVGGCAVAAVGATAAVVALQQPEDRPPRALPSSAPTSVSVSAPVSVPGRVLEIYIFGRTTMKTLTTEVNGQVETVVGPPLPFSRKVAVPPEPTPVKWRFTFTATPGQYSYAVTVGGYTLQTGSGSSTSTDIEKTVSSDDT